MIKSIEIESNGNVIKLTTEEAKQLYNELGDLLGVAKEKIVYVPTPSVQPFWEWNPNRVIVTTSDTTDSDFNDKYEITYKNS